MRTPSVYPRASVFEQLPDCCCCKRNQVTELPLQKSLLGGCWILGTGYWTQIAGCRLPKVKYLKRDATYRYSGQYTTSR